MVSLTGVARAQTAELIEDSFLKRGVKLVQAIKDGKNVVNRGDVHWQHSVQYLPNMFFHHNFEAKCVICGKSCSPVGDLHTQLCPLRTLSWLDYCCAAAQCEQSIDWHIKVLQYYLDSSEKTPKITTIFKPTESQEV